MDRPDEHELLGRTIARGIGFGYVHVEHTAPGPTQPRRIPPHAVQEEVERLRDALARVREHIEEHVRQFHSPTDEELEQVLGTHLLMLEDHHFFAHIEERIAQELLPAESAVEAAFSAAAARLDASRDEYFRNRAEDLRDHCQLLREALLHGEGAFSDSLITGRPVVFVLTHLHPSAVMRARRAGAKAFVTTSTAYSAHGAILLRAFGIPAVGGVPFSDELFVPEAPILVDGDTGELYVNPTEERQREVRERAARVRPARVNRSVPAAEGLTADGTEVVLWANIDTPQQVDLCFEERLHGIGLFRTEYMVLSAGRIPDEEEQYTAYRSVVDQLAGRPVVFRTFDIGAEKTPGGLQEDLAPNPAMGLRGLRRHLVRRPDELRTQLRAILRATVGGDAAVLLPMVTHPEDIRAARGHLSAVRDELRAKGIPFNEDVRVGAMVEIPSAALRVAEILAEVDFVSIGTNDLVQYLTAADRDNTDVIGYLDPEASGVYLLIASILGTARSLGRQSDVLVGGELPSDPKAAEKLVRLGVRGLIVAPRAAQSVRDALSGVHVTESAD